jgi:hypothetical protein
MKNLRVLLPVVLLTLVACNGDSGGSAASSTTAIHKPKSTQTAKAGPTREEQTAGMVLAASPSRSAAVGELKFDIHSRPLAGVPLNIDMALLPAVDVPTLTLQLSGSDGLAITAGDESQSFADVSRFNVYRKSATVTPAAEGMYFLTVVATFKNVDSVDVRNYSIPIIAGAAGAAAGASGTKATSKSAAATAANAAAAAAANPKH